MFFSTRGRVRESPAQGLFPEGVGKYQSVISIRPFAHGKVHEAEVACGRRMGEARPSGRAATDMRGQEGP
jgi:hypothetical protein